MADETGSFIFGGNTGLTYDQLKQRRAIAQALASRSKGFPKNVGEGMTYLGESIGEGLQDIGLRRGELAMLQRGQDVQKNAPVSPYTPPAVAPVTPAPPPVAAPPAAPPPTAPAAGSSDAGDDGSAGVATSAWPAVADAGPAALPPFGGDMPPPSGPSPFDSAAAAPPASFNDRFVGAAPVQTAEAGAAPPTFKTLVTTPPSNAPETKDTYFNASQGAPSARERAAAVIAQRDDGSAGVATSPWPAPVDAQSSVSLPSGADVPYPHGDPRTTGGVRATMEAVLAKAGRGPTAIAGIERNVRDESGFDPNLRHADQPKFSGEAHFAHGLYQEGGDEWNNYVNWINKNAPGSDWRDPALQSRFLGERLNSKQYADTSAKLDAAQTPGQAADAFLRGYLKPAPQYLAQRSAQYRNEDAVGSYANRQIAQGGDPGAATMGQRMGTGVGDGRVGGAPAEDDTRDLVAAALLDQQQKKPPQAPTDDSQSYLQDVLGMTGRSGLAQRPTASLGRGGVASDVSLPVLAPMGRLGAAPPPAAAPGGPSPAPATPDPRDAVTQAIVQQQGLQQPDASAPAGAPDISQQPGPVGPQAFGPAPPAATAGNPATQTDIQPMPTGGPGAQLAQGPQAPVPQSIQRPSQEPIPPVDIKPFPPQRPAPTRPDILGPDPAMDYWQKQANNPFNDPDTRAYAAQKFQQIDQFRKEKQAQNDATWNMDMQVWNAENVARREYELKYKPEQNISRQQGRLGIEKSANEIARDPIVTATAQANLEKAQLEARKAQQGIITPSPTNPAAPYPVTAFPPSGDPRLGTSQSPQRTGVPALPPVPPGVAPEKWSELQAPEAQKAIEAIQTATPQFNDAIKAIQEARTHPGMEKGTGLQGHWLRNVPGTEAYAFGKLMDQINGKTFLNAYTTLRGGGQISNVEGEKATAAQGRTNPDQSPAELKKGLDELEVQLRRDMETAQRKGNQPVTAWRKPGDNSSYAPDIGEVRGSKKYIGGNPANPMSWQDAR